MEHVNFCHCDTRPHYFNQLVIYHKSVVVPLKDILMERVQGNYGLRILDVLRWDGDHSYHVPDDFLPCLDGDPELKRQDL